MSDSAGKPATYEDLYGLPDKVTAEPFAALEIDLSNLWLGYEPAPSREPD